MGSAKRALISLALLALTGCTAREVRDGICQGIYEGARINQGKEKSPAERAREPNPDYYQYDKERKELLETNREE